MRHQAISIFLTAVIGLAALGARAAVALSAGRIVFISNRDGESYVSGYNQIYIMDVDGSHLTRLTNLSGGAAQPAFTPDGGKIAFISADPTLTSPSVDHMHNKIYIMHTDGSNTTPLTHLLGWYGWPAFSPDGRRIAFVAASLSLGAYTVYTMNADGSHQTRLPISMNSISSPKFSPNGRRLAFDGEVRAPTRLFYEGAEGVEATLLIYFMDIDGSHPTRLTNFPIPRL